MTQLSETGDLSIAFTLNGLTVRREIQTSRVLSDLLRDDLGLTGTKPSCGRGVCGACTVLVDGTPRAACSTFAFEIDGASVRTIEGLEGGNGDLDPIQAAFARNSAFQCGFCTPGMIMLVRGLLDENPNPTRAQIREWISSNICRCTGYQMIIEAVEQAAATLAARKADK